MSKGDFHFAAAAQIGRLLGEFKDGCLGRYTPCQGLSGEALIDAIAVTHVEFILIHPFREGNGRLSRLLADVMAVQAGRDPMDYSAWEADRDGYFAAIRSDRKLRADVLVRAAGSIGLRLVTRGYSARET